MLAKAKQKYSTNPALIKGLISIAGFPSHKKFANNLGITNIHLSRVINGTRYSKIIRLAITKEIRKGLLKNGVKNIEVRYEELWPKAA